MDKKLEGNEDWIARGEGRHRSKGAQAAERASAGLGATDHDAELRAEYPLTGPLQPRLAPKSPGADNS
jgi:hypothetical protein